MFFSRRCLPVLKRSHLALAMLSYEQQKSQAGDFSASCLTCLFLAMMRHITNAYILYLLRLTRFFPGSTRILGPLATLRRFGPYCITSHSDVITPETQPLSTLSVITVIQ